MPRKKRTETVYHPPRRIKGRKGYYITYSENGRSKRISTGTDDEQEANRYYRQFLAGIHATPAPDIVYLRDALNHYSTTMGQRTRDPKKIKSRCGKILDYFHDIPVQQITQSMCQGYCAMRRKEKGKTGKPIRNGTVRRELGIMSAALSCIYKEGWIPYKPYVWRPADDPSPRRAMTKEQCRKLLAVCIQNHVKTFIVLGLTTGARKEAITELTWQRVDFANRTIDFNLTEAEASALGHKNIQRMKGRAFVRMNSLAYGQLLIARELAQTDFVIEYNGKRAKTLSKAFKETRDRAGLPEWITPHVMRHTAATLTLASGIAPYEVAGLLGHKNVNTTIQQYGHHHPDYQKQAAKVLEDLG